MADNIRNDNRRKAAPPVEKTLSKGKTEYSSHAAKAQETETTGAEALDDASASTGKGTAVHEEGKPDSGEKKWTWQEVAAKNREQLKEVTDRLEAGVKEFMTTDTQFKKVLETMAKFHHYSASNVMLIAMQMPNATYVASYTNWKSKFKRQVKKGQKGISIIAPASYKKKVEQEVLDTKTGKPVLDAQGNPKLEEVEITVPRFKVVKTFDISQTVGEPLPELDVPELAGSAENYQLFMDALVSVSPAPIRFADVSSKCEGAKGYYDNVKKEIVIQEGMSEVQTLKTAIHEVSHARLHDREVMKESGIMKDQKTKELEAESIAYTVLSRYHIDSSGYSFPYLASWSASQDTSALRASMDTIRKTAAEIIDEMDAFIAERMRDRDVDRYIVYQIREGSPAEDYYFMDMDFIKEKGYSIHPDYYKQVYQGALKPDDTLETIYGKFNHNPPVDFQGHSMSMSDIVVFHREGQDHAYYVDSVGFLEIPEFLHPDLSRERQDIAESQNAGHPADSRQQEQKQDQLIADRAGQMTGNTGPDVMEPGSVLTFYVAECMEFPVMGKFYSGLTLTEAVDTFNSLPTGGVQGEKGIGFSLRDGSRFSGDFPLVRSGIVQDEKINAVEHFRNIPALQEAITQVKDRFPERTVTEDRTVPEKMEGTVASAVHEYSAAGETSHAEAKAVPAERESHTPRAGSSDRAEQSRVSVRTDRKEAGGRKESVLAALREHQKKVNAPGKDVSERSRTTQRKKGEHAL